MNKILIKKAILRMAELAVAAIRETRDQVKHFLISQAKMPAFSPAGSCH
jgi:hypothetical protein